MELHFLNRWQDRENSSDADENQKTLMPHCLAGGSWGADRAPRVNNSAVVDIAVLTFFPDPIPWICATDFASLSPSTPCEYQWSESQAWCEMATGSGVECFTVQL